VAKLIGAPPGYVGYEEEGQLTGKLRKKPYSVVLFDEIEKAHPAVLDLFLQLFDEGRLTDAKGKKVDGRNALFIMTSNIGTDRLGKRSIGFGASERKNDVKELIAAGLKEYLRPEFINRIDEAVIFNTLRTEDLVLITNKLLSELQERLNDQEIAISVTQEAINFLCTEGFSLEYGARPLARAIEQLIVAPLAEKIVRGEIKKGCKVKIDFAGTKIIISESYP
jgi:ATP-dependent Clp protease ATP-binding subunit ClpA